MHDEPCRRAPPRPKSRERVLTDDEIRLAWHGSERLSGLFGPLVKLLILTGQRRAEVAGMTWSEIDVPNRTWRLAGERTKNGRAHEVDLSDQALAAAVTATQAFAARLEREDQLMILGIGSDTEVLSPLTTDRVKAGQRANRPRRRPAPISTPCWPLRRRRFPSGSR